MELAIFYVIISTPYHSFNDLFLFTGGFGTINIHKANSPVRGKDKTVVTSNIPANMLISMSIMVSA